MINTLFESLVAILGCIIFMGLLSWAIQKGFSYWPSDEDQIRHYARLQAIYEKEYAKEKRRGGRR